VFPGSEGKRSLGASFDRWMGHIEWACSSRKLSLEDMAVLSGVATKVRSGALDAYRNTLGFANRLVKRPMSVVDDLAELPFKVADRAVGK